MRALGERAAVARDDGGASAHLAALEALFAPKVVTPPPPPAKRDSAKMVTAPARGADAIDRRERERDKLLQRVLAATSRTDVTRAIDAMRAAGFELPEDQETQLQALEHTNEERVCEALLVLERIVATEALRRRAVLESRLRRIEECADEASTRDLAARVRRKLARVRAS